MEVAVIGGGLAGLSGGWLLSQNPENKVTLFEKESTIGMDAASVDLFLKDEKISNESSFRRTTEVPEESLEESVRVDVPLRVFSPSYYPNLMNLYKVAGVNVVPEDYAGTFCDLQGVSYFRYCNFLFKDLSLSFIPLGLNLFNPDFFSICINMIKFFYHTPRDLKIHNETGNLHNLTIDKYLKDKGYSSAFIEKFFLPSCASMCTCPYDDLRGYPAPILLDYLVKRSGYGVRRVDDGVKVITEKLSKNFHTINCGSSVVEVYPAQSDELKKGKVVVVSKNGDKQYFDHVILATEANTALRLLKQATENQKEALSSFKYVKSTVTVHTDPKLMPAKKDEWAPVNLFTSENCKMPMATIWMNKVQNSFKNRPTNVFQTWNPLFSIDKKSILSSSEFVRPVMSLESVKGIDILSRCQGEGNIWICGSYSLYGMPLLENACCSGIQVAESLGMKRPWSVNDRSYLEQRSNWTEKIITVVVILIVLMISFTVKQMIL